ncbi:hypothetical protein Pisl_1681 [Pyrobaculum islandicum DSM 4184]|uniref:Uncharacterized protein n=1 Tax=Pyrobaculum islandicum (strain DSM 4184 / JCM 9189 / GEO3) TaxID=384616 RepID=A1RV51_PYRIL|nr:hypothetical protein Pisl_1681 [Pyrobaculum islandicum DSM 4184]
MWGAREGLCPEVSPLPALRVGKGRDVAAVINIEKRALEVLKEGRVPPGPMPNDPTPEVSWMPMKAWARRKSLGVGTDGRRITI